MFTWCYIWQVGRNTYRIKMQELMGPYRNHEYYQYSLSLSTLGAHGFSSVPLSLPSSLFLSLSFSVKTEVLVNLRTSLVSSKAAFTKFKESFLAVTRKWHPRVDGCCERDGSSFRF